jgi:hypothetical protein
MRSKRPLLNHRPRRRPRPSRPTAGPARPAPASSATVQPRADDAPSWTRRATTPTRPSQPHDCLPHCHAPRPFRSATAAAGRHGHRTPTPDAGGRRPDTGHLDAQTPVPDTGHRSVGQPPVGHWTLAPDTDADRATTAQPASGPPEPPCRGTAHWTPSRVPALPRPGSCWVAPLARPRLGALLSSDEFRVERRAGGSRSSVMASAAAVGTVAR